MPDLVDLFVAQVEGYFGVYESAEVREDVRRLLARRVMRTKAHFEAAYEALKEYQEIRFGPPDTATTLKALDAWEKDRGRSLAPPRHPESFSTAAPPSPEETTPPTPEDLAEVRRIVAAAAARDPVGRFLQRVLGYES